MRGSAEGAGKSWSWAASNDLLMRPKEPNAVTSMPAMRPASANRQAKRQSPTRSRTMRRYVRCRAAGRPRIAADARALRARAGRGSIPGRRSLLGGHAGCRPSLVAFRTSDRPLRRSIAADLFARRRRGLAARGRRHHHGPPAVHLADRRRTWWRRPARGAVLSGDRIGEERPARPRDGVAHLLDAGGFLHRSVHRRRAAELARYPDRPGGDDRAARLHHPWRPGRQRYAPIVAARTCAA